MWASNTNQFYDKIIKLVKLCNKPKEAIKIDNRGLHSFKKKKKIFDKNKYLLIISLWDNIPQNINQQLKLLQHNNSNEIYEDIKKIIN